MGTTNVLLATGLVIRSGEGDNQRSHGEGLISRVIEYVMRGTNYVVIATGLEVRHSEGDN